MVPSTGNAETDPPPINRKGYRSMEPQEGTPETSGLTTQVDNYCERLDASFWAEPVNAITNLPYLLVALWMGARALRAGDGGAQLLAVLLGAIAIGSFLFHTVAERWAGIADVLPILLFILVYVFYACRRFLALPLWAAALGMLAVLPWSIAVGAAVNGTVGSINGSEAYLGTLFLFFIFAALLARRDPDTTRGVLIGAGLLTLSLTARSLDQTVCGVFPLGTHFLWHLLNSAMFAVMIPVLMARRTPPETPSGGTARV
ncbi:MAG: ceramidase domain-containing protein [Pseudomonadota bacterium]